MDATQKEIIKNALNKAAQHLAICDDCDGDSAELGAEAIQAIREALAILEKAE